MHTPSPTCTDPSISLGLATISGYVVRRTFFGGDEHRDEAIFTSPSDYGAAIEVARDIRAEPNHHGYAVVDPVYACGCRGRG